MVKPQKTDVKTVTAGRRSTRLVGASANVTDRDVARRAYELYLARGSEHGHDVDDWTAAERELRARSMST
jgi:hypothetical protein